ncbi:MAG: hypothetical protein ACTS6J_12160 [Burkholderiales bacterium]
MADLEIMRLCAEAMGVTCRQDSDRYGQFIRIVNHAGDLNGGAYDPLHDDAQAMALVKKLRLTIELAHEGWWVCGPEQKHEAQGNNLNRAICECVAKMQQSKVQP